MLNRLCVKLAVKRILRFPRAKILICSDSLFFRFALVHIRSTETLLVEIQNAISTINNYDLNLDFQHLQGHSGILENERTLFEYSRGLICKGNVFES